MEVLEYNLLFRVLLHIMQVVVVVWLMEAQLLVSVV